MYHPKFLGLAPGNRSPLKCHILAHRRTHTQPHTHTNTHTQASKKGLRERCCLQARMSATGIGGLRWAKEYEMGHQLLLLLSHFSRVQLCVTP